MVAKKQQPEPNLPPAGYKRDEELAKRKDELEQKGEEQFGNIGKIPDAFFEEDREIQDAIHKDYMAIGVGHPLYVTKWVNFVNLHSQEVWRAKADGWLVADGKVFPEAKHLVCEDSTIRVGDVMLMYIRKDRHMQLMLREEKKRLKRELGIEEEIVDFVARYPKVFKQIQSTMTGGNMHPKTQEMMMKRVEAMSGMQKMALQQLSNRMHDGFVEGLPLDEKAMKGGS